MWKYWIEYTGFVYTGCGNTELRPCLFTSAGSLGCQQPVLVQHWHHRQGAPPQIDVGYISLCSHHLWGTQGAGQLLNLRGTIGCTIGCSLQMIWTPQVPGSPLEPWHSLWSCTCYQCLGEPTHVAPLSYCLNKDVFFNVW